MFDPVLAALVIVIPLGLIGAICLRVYDVQMEKYQARKKGPRA